MGRREVKPPQFFPARPRVRMGSFIRSFAKTSPDRRVITGSNLTFGESNVDQSAYSVGSHTFDPNSLGILWVYNTATTPNLASSIVDSRSLTWTQIPGGTQLNSANRITGYYCPIDAAVGAGTIQLNFAPGDVTTGCIWAVDQFRGCVLGAGAFRNVQNNNAGASLGQTLTLPTFEHVNNCHVYAIGHNAAEQKTVGVGFTQLSDQSHGLPPVGIEIAFKANDTTADPSWPTSAASRWVHFELVSA